MRLYSASEVTVNSWILRMSVSLIALVWWLGTIMVTTGLSNVFLTIREKC